MKLSFRLDDLSGAKVQDLLRRHLGTMAEHSPPESRHALDLSGLRAADVTFWSLWDGEALVGFGALKELDPEHGEIKSMHTAMARRGQGIGAAMLEHILAEARRRGYRRLSLETGSMAGFAPARALYAKYGFAFCPPFAGYRLDPNSVFMTRAL
ncbi:MAG: GNAT family N-acetyltransferase [Alphaproteobacteria bacterium]